VVFGFCGGVVADGAAAAADLQIAYEAGSLPYSRTCWSSSWLTTPDQERDPTAPSFSALNAYALERQTAHIAYLRHDHLHTFSAANLETTGQEQRLVQEFWLAYPAMPSPIIVNVLLR